MAESEAERYLHRLNVTIYEAEKRAHEDCEEYRSDAEASSRARMVRLSDELRHVRAQRDAIVKELGTIKAMETPPPIIVTAQKKD